ncbi:MAG: molybdate ABC transporter permease subunit [Acidimicrobiales bacterium]|nr:molybdate ABC transporter permease subunit [Acidimicrobiales bacterium]
MSRTIKDRPPGLLVALAAIAIALFGLPLLGLVTRTPWTELGSILTSDVVIDALWLSVVTSIAAAALSLVFGLPLAWLLARVEFRGRDAVRALVTLPMVLPPVVGGTALLLALGRRGVVGEPINDATGFLLPFSIWGVILANTFVAMPFLVITVEGALRNLDPRFETAAATLGAGPLTVFNRITVPAILPALRAGTVIAWARSLGEFGATVTFAGNLQGRTQTLPLAVFVALESDRDTAVAISLLMVVISFVVLISLRDRWWSTR